MVLICCASPTLVVQHARMALISTPKEGGISVCREGRIDWSSGMNRVGSIAAVWNLHKSSRLNELASAAGDLHKRLSEIISLLIKCRLLFAETKSQNNERSRRAPATRCEIVEFG